jgi:uncharacterized caspase-like protein
MLRAAVGLFMATLLWCGTAHAGEQRRVALVIGNSAYKYAGKLPNPVNDAGDVAKSLERLGFVVTLERDLEWDALARSVDTFLNVARGADVAIFFYAGHGLQHDGGAFILPVDARLENEFSIKRETFSAQEIVSQLGSTTHASIVLLDACRNNPLAEKLRGVTMSGSRAVNVGRGLGRIDVGGGNSLVVYSAAPGQEARDGLGRNSPFTEALLKHIETPGLEVEQMLKRVTAEVNNTTGGKQQPERLSQLKIEVTLRTAEAVDPMAGNAAAAAAAAASISAHDDETKRQAEGLRRKELEVQAERLKAKEERLKAEQDALKRDAELRAKEDSLRKRNQMIEDSRRLNDKETEALAKKNELLKKKEEELARKRDDDLLKKRTEELDAARREREQMLQANERNNNRFGRPQPKQAVTPTSQAMEYSAPETEHAPSQSGHAGGRASTEPERHSQPVHKTHPKKETPAKRVAPPQAEPAVQQHRPPPIEYAPPPSAPSSRGSSSPPP